MWLCDVLNWEMVCCELRGARVTAKPVRRPFQCAVQPWDARHKKTTDSPCHRTTTRYYKELVRTTMFHSGTTPVLLSTTKCYSGTTPYYKVRLRTIPYYSALQSSTPYYKVLRRTPKYYAVLQSTTPVLLRTTKYYSGTTPYY